LQQLLGEQVEDSINRSAIVIRRWLAVLVLNREADSRSSRGNRQPVLLTEFRFGGTAKESGEKPWPLCRSAGLFVSIDIANEISASRAVAIFHRETAAIECEAYASPGTVEGIVDVNAAIGALPGNPDITRRGRGRRRRF